MRWMTQIALSCAFAASCTTANALPIVNLVPTSASVTEGTAARVDVLVSGLEDEFIGAYDLTLGWDASLLSLDAVTFDTFLDGPLDSLNGFETVAGALSIFEISLAGLTNQAGLSEFRLFSLDFSTLSAGLAALSLSGDTQILSNEFGVEYEGFGIRSTSLQITAVTEPPTSVPEPASVSLLLIGLAGTLGLRRRRA